MILQHIQMLSPQYVQVGNVICDILRPQYCQIAFPIFFHNFQVIFQGAYNGNMLPYDSARPQYY